MHLSLRSSSKTPELQLIIFQLLHAEKMLYEDIHSREVCNFSALLPSGMFQDAIHNNKIMTTLSSS